MPPPARSCGMPCACGSNAAICTISMPMCFAAGGTRARPAVARAGWTSDASFRKSARPSRGPAAGVAELFISRRAEADLRDIWRYIAADNPGAADRVLLRIDQRAQVLRRFPRIGAARNDIRKGMRMLVEGNYLLLYEYDARRDEVELVAIVDGRRELSGLF